MMFMAQTDGHESEIKITLPPSLSWRDRFEWYFDDKMREHQLEVWSRFSPRGEDGLLASSLLVQGAIGALALPGALRDTLEAVGSNDPGRV